MNSFKEQGNPEITTLLTRLSSASKCVKKDIRSCSVAGSDLYLQCVRENLMKCSFCMVDSSVESHVNNVARVSAC